jgi:hypothetical protein
MARALGLWRELDLPSNEAMALTVLSRVAAGLGDVESSARLGEEALALFRALGHDSGAAIALVHRAQLARDLGDDRRAATDYHDALQLWLGLNERWALVWALAGLAAIAAAQGQPAAATTLVGAIDARLQEGDSRGFPTERKLCERAAAVARAALGEERCAELRAAGRALPLAQAIAEALALADLLAARAGSGDRPSSPRNRVAEAPLAREHEQFPN